MMKKIFRLFCGIVWLRGMYNNPPSKCKSENGSDRRWGVRSALLCRLFLLSLPVGFLLQNLFNALAVLYTCYLCYVDLIANLIHKQMCKCGLIGSNTPYRLSLSGGHLSLTMPICKCIGTIGAVSHLTMSSKYIQ